MVKKTKTAEARPGAGDEPAAPESAGAAPDAIEALLAELSAHFQPAEIKCKPAVVSGNRALALFYVDARVIQDRLDNVLGPVNWQDDYEVIDGGVICRLRIRLGDEWITKVDVGGPSEQPDGGDRMKAAFSDSLKRAAVKFGIGRYLYRTPAIWADYDPKTRQFVRPPVMPGAAEPSQPPPARELSEVEKSFALCKTALQGAAAKSDLDRFQIAYRDPKRAYTAAQLKELDKIYLARAADFGKAKQTTLPSNDQEGAA